MRKTEKQYTQTSTNIPSSPGRPDTPVGRTNDESIPLPDKSVGPTGRINSSLNKRQHHLPHWQQGGSVYFITFRSAIGILPAEARALVIETISYDDGRRYDLHLAVVMPDHVHMLIQPCEQGSEEWYDLSYILKTLKGISARRINKLLGRTGTVWQQESYDRIVRNEDEFLEKWNYMLNNALKTGLVENPMDYEFILTGISYLGQPDKSVGPTGVI